MTKHYQPNNGQCVCEIHRQFEAKHGYTVDEWYERNPSVQPWHMESCGRCSDCPLTKKADSSVMNSQSEPTPTPTKRHVEPAPTKQTQPTPTPEPVAAQVEQEEPARTMCEPTRHVDTTPTHDAFVSFVVNFAIKATCFTAALPIVAIVGIIAILWKYRHMITDGVLDTADMVGGAVLAPFEAAHRMATAPKRQSYDVQVGKCAVKTGPFLLTGQNVITDPSKLLEAKPQDFIEIKFAERPEQVLVRR